MNRRLFSIVLVTILLCLALGNGIACTGEGTTTYTLTIASTAGGSVTPAVGTHTYDAGATVNLTATADSGFSFVNWTGGGADIDDADAATTSITMNADHIITAHFALGVFIDNVPDTNQPPTSGSINYCAPTAMTNILKYWDVPININAYNVTAGLPAKTAADYLGWFMDTNNAGSPARGNGVDGHSGTWDKDIAQGTVDFVRWDAGHLPPPVPPPPPPALPAGKLGYDWTVTTNCFTPAEYAPSLALYETEIDAGRPLVVSFTYWNPVDKDIAVTDPGTGETIDVFAWGSPVNYSTDPVEYWDEGIGHAVTAVGYILNWDPDGAGPLGSADYVIVHDNWASTPTNVAIPWLNWKCLFPVDPGSYEHLPS
jgi:hypothetical protein